VVVTLIKQLTTASVKLVNAVGLALAHHLPL
jgi:hypothetical protein